MKRLIPILILCFCISTSYAQRKSKKNKETVVEKKEEPSMVSSFKFRNVGPAFCSGRIADIAVHPDNENHWYLAVGSGGVWETENAGISWKPIFDDQSSYSTGCITIDHRNPSTIWLGSGENVGGRHVGYGDGVYKSTDGGQSWKNMGLEKSEHISKIIVHPENSNVVWVAAQGPLWSKGGERGLYKTIDGGTTWKQVLGDDEWIGVTDLLIDPRNPDMLYAATWQRHRTVAALMGGGPGSGLHRSYDGGETWEKLTNGIPKSNLGKIGMAISPQQPDVIYAAIELDRRTGGLFRSDDRGSSWTKMSNAVSGATGPHYYQELYACPHNFDRLYLMDVRVQVSDDGGKNFRRMKEENKHSDNHALIFREDDPNYLLIGTDAGIYESFDLAENWRYTYNLPLTQYYKVAVDDREPFYHIYGGTQDNGSHAGPSATDDVIGIRNADWYKTLYADGHQSATEPGNPDIIYAETQQGGMHRIDLKTGEQVMIQPQDGEGENYERFNWDAPIIVSPHDPATIFFASQRVWKSENRGDSWEAISGDLSRDEERVALKIMGKYQSWDNPWDIYAMSNYNSVTSLSQSPLDANVIYAGTDDGIIQVTQDGGENWNKIMVNTITGLPDRAFVNDLKADLHDKGTVYAVFDNHKEGDFEPYVYKSTNYGASWTSLTNNIPERTLTWRIVQDHVKKDLLFLATEFGVYASLNGGAKWEKLGGTPTISFRDLVIQKRENDLVAASFGRGFYVLDDYSALREITDEKMKEPASLYTGREAKLFVPRSRKGNGGADYWTAPNPTYGAVFRYNINEEFKTKKQVRKEIEKELIKEDKDVHFQGYDAMAAEKLEIAPRIWFTIKDKEGNVVRNLKMPAKKGAGSIAWDLRHSSPRAIRPGQEERSGRRWGGGHYAAPGEYSVTMSKEVDGVVTSLTKPETFTVAPLREGTLKPKSPEEYQDFANELNWARTQQSAISNRVNENLDKYDAFVKAMERSSMEPGALNETLFALKAELDKYTMMLYGNPAKDEVGEKSNSSVGKRLGTASRGLTTLYGPTSLHMDNLELAKKELAKLVPLIQELDEVTIPAIEQKLMNAGAPYIQGQAIPKTRDRP